MAIANTDLSPARTHASVLRRLYLSRGGFAIAWALALFSTASHLSPVAVVLLVAYPLVDALAAAVDARSAVRPARALSVNLAVSLLVAVGVGVAAASGIPAVLRVWGIWAIVAGLAQVVVALSRRALGGQWPMILSGGISTVVGLGFILMAGHDGAKLTSVAGYAVAGGLFFLVSALRLRSTR